MDKEILNQILELGGQAGILWVALFFLVKNMKLQYETRITALETSAAACERDRFELHRKIEEILRDQLEFEKKTQALHSKGVIGQ